jgi:hypothetical protein
LAEELTLPPVVADFVELGASDLSLSSGADSVSLAVDRVAVSGAACAPIDEPDEGEEDAGVVDAALGRALLGFVVAGTVSTGAGEDEVGAG